MYPHARNCSQRDGFAQPSRYAGAEQCSANSLLHPPEGAHTSFEAALQEVLPWNT